LCEHGHSTKNFSRQGADDAESVDLVALVATGKSCRVSDVGGADTPTWSDAGGADTPTWGAGQGGHW
jgi:hypothetical protein